MRSSIASVGLGVAALIATGSAMAGPIPEYHAFYRSVDESAAGSADVSLSYDSGSSIYTLAVKRVDETTRELGMTLQFKLVDDRVRPLTYRQQTGTCVSCSVLVTFDWDGRHYGYDSGGYQHLYSLTQRDGAPSDMVRFVAMLVANLPGRRELADFHEPLAVQSLGTVELMTPLGPVHADGRALRGETSAAVWLARELEHLPVRMLTFAGGSYMTVELAELQGIELSAALGPVTVDAGAIVDPAASEAPASSMPEYRAVYRVDENKKIGFGRLETAVNHDRASNRYEFTATAIEMKHPERALLLKMPFRLVGEGVQPIAVHMEEHGRRAWTVDIEFDWTLREAVVRNDDYQERYPLTAFEGGGAQSPAGFIGAVAGLVAFLPGGREIAGFGDLLSSESLGATALSLPMGSVPVEQLVLRGDGKDMSVEVWRARELADLPVRISGPLMARKATTMELTELHGLERAAVTGN